MKSYLWIGCAALALLGCGSRQDEAVPAAEAPQAVAGGEAAALEGPEAVAGKEGAAQAGQEAGTATAPSAADAERSTAAASASPGKPHAPIEAVVLGRPALQSGVPGKVRIEVRPGVAVDGLSVQVAGDAALTVVGPASFRFGALAAGEAVEVEVAVTPTSGGVGRLSALLTLEKGGQQQARPVTLALEVGGPVTLRAPAEKPAAPPVQDATGELIHSMPAETTVGKP